MTTQDVQRRYEGDTYIDFLDDQGGQIGFIGPVDGQLFSWQINAEQVSAKSKMRGTYGQEKAVLNNPSETNISLNLISVPEAVLAAQMMGTIVSANQAAGSLTDEPLVAKLDRWLFVGKRNLTAASDVLTDSTGTTTYVNGTDYELNERLGLVMPLSGGAISADEALLFDASYGAITQNKINGVTRSQVRARILIDLYDQVNGKDAEAIVYNAMMTPNQAIDLFSDAHIEAQFNGKAMTPVNTAVDGTAPIVLILDKTYG